MTTPSPKKNPIQTWRAPSKQSPARINVSRIFAEPQQSTPSTSATSVLESKLPPPPELLETTEETRRLKRERDPSPLNRAVTADDVTSCHGGSTAAEPRLEEQYSNKRVKRSADVPESTDGTIRRKNSVMNGGWFGQRGRERPSKPKPVSERVESDRASIQSTTSLQPRHSEISQLSPAPTPAPETPSLRNPSSTTPVASGSQVVPIAVPLKAATASNNTPSGSPTCGGWLGSLRPGPSQPAGVQEPQPSTMSALVSEPIHMDLDLPTTLPAQVPNSKPPTRTGWFSKSSLSPPTPVQQSLPDQSIPPSPTPSLPVIEAPPTSASVVPVPAAVTLNTSAARYILNIPLPGRSKRKTQEEAVADVLATISPSGPSIPSSPPKAPSVTVSEPAPSSASAGWWGYIGLGHGVGPKAIEDGIEAHTAHKRTSLAPSIASPQPQMATSLPVSVKPRPQSVISPPGGSWLRPWGWSGSDAPTLGEKTEAERIKDAALARPDPSLLSSPSPSIDIGEQSNVTKLATSAPTTGLGLEINPIMKDMQENRTSWINFLSLRAAHRYRVVTESGEPAAQEVGEVMDLEVDPTFPPPEELRIEETVKAQKGSRWIGQWKQPKGAIGPPPGSPGKKGSESPIPNPMPPLTDSDSIKGKAALASANDKEQRARPPNMLLPTFEDTFYTLPRCIPPYRPPPLRSGNATLKTLKKVGELVSGVLLGKVESKPDGAEGSVRVKRSEMREWQIRHGRLPNPPARPVSPTSPSSPSPVHSTFSGPSRPRSNSASHARNLEPYPLVAARDVGTDLPRVGEVLSHPDIGELYATKRIAVIGIHGWFPNAIMRTLLGEPTGTSPKFASMMKGAIETFLRKKGVRLEGDSEGNEGEQGVKITCIPLEGEGTVERRVEKLYLDFLSNETWVEDLHQADVIFMVTHSQGSIVSTQLLDRLIQKGHIHTGKNWEMVQRATEIVLDANGLPLPPDAITQRRSKQRVCCLALCGIHLGPLMYLNASSVVHPYIQYFESAAARELFEFQDTGSEVSKKYVAALENVLDHGVKFVYVASLDDQVVPIYSGIFTSVNHPRILRALYLDGDAYSSSDFLANLLVLLLRIRNAGIDDGGLLTDLSEATAGSLSGVGHSNAYLDGGAYTLAVRFLFETSDALSDVPTFEFEPFTTKAARNDYEIPWSLRGLISDPRCQELFGREFDELRAQFDDWHPKTAVLREMRRKLEPIKGRRSRFATTSPAVAAPSEPSRVKG